MQNVRKIKIDSLSEWFPANDRFASKMARICILREELMFELHSYMESRNETKQSAYKHSWKGVYYFRKMHVTIVEIRSAVFSLAIDKEFVSFLSRQSPGFQDQFIKLREQLESTAKEIKDFRSDLGAHIKEDSMYRALQSSRIRNGVLQISKDHPRETHYEFAGELLMALMLKNNENNDQLQEANVIMERFLQTTHYLFQRIDTLFFGYLFDRNLLKPPIS